MFELKPLSKEAVSGALEKAQRYRLLNEPMEAESICRDVLAVEPDHQEALVTLLLALTDQLDERLQPTLEQALGLLPRIADEYHRLYYRGILAERQAKARWRRGGPHAGHMAYDLLREAMLHFDHAAELRPAGNDDALLRWNTCARLIAQHPQIVPAPGGEVVDLLE